MEDAKALEMEISRRRRSLKETLSGQERKIAEEFLERHGEFKVCANCAGLDIGTPPTSLDASLVAFKETWRYYCTTCGYEGIPLVFMDIAPYEKFFRARRQSYNEGRDQIEPNYLLPHSFSEPGHGRKRYVAVILSFMIPGLGQAYRGEKGKAAKVFTVYALSMGLFVLAGQIFLYNARSYGVAGHSISWIALLLAMSAFIGLAASYLYAASDAFFRTGTRRSFRRNGKVLKMPCEGS